MESIKEKNQDVLRLLAQNYLKLQKYDNAIKNYTELIKLKQSTINDIFNLSLAYYYKNDYENSLKYALEYYNKENNDISVCYHIALIYKDLNNDEKHLEYLLKAAQIQPSTDLFYNIGVLYRKLGKNEEALNYFNAIIQADPDYKNAYLNIAKIYQDIDKNIALQIYSELFENYSDDIQILNQLYITFREMLKYDLAYNTALKIIKLDSDKAYPYMFAGECLFELGKYSEAVSMLETAKEHEECNMEFCDVMIANAYSITNQNKKAIEIIKTNYPNLTKTSSIYAWIQFRDKNIEEGRDAMHNSLCIPYKDDYIEKRAVSFFYKLNLDKKYNMNELDLKKSKPDKIKENKIQHYIEKDLYGNNPDNKKILLYNAHGAGDLIMLSRYIHILDKHTKDITLQVPKSMLRLMEYNFPQYKIITDEKLENPSDYDYTSDFVCLLCCLNEISLKDIPYSSKYLDIPEYIVKEKSQLDIMKTNKKKIGIFWMGNPLIMPQRSIKLKELESLFDIENIQIYSFQLSTFDYESDEKKAELPLIDLASYIKDYMDTAGFLKNIDVLVTIDSSIANLAGAMGVKTFLLLPFRTDWRWFYDTNKTSWYDSVKLFKQTEPFNWKDVIERVKYELEV